MLSRSFRWMWSALLFGVANGPLSTLITLNIIDMGGGPVMVAYAITLSNVILIPASIFWGFMADRIDRKKLVMAGFGFSTLFLLLASMSHSIPQLDLNYAGFTFFSTAYSTPMNLIIMENVDKKRWSSAFSTLSMLSSVGYLVGLLISTFLVLFIRITEIYLVLSLFAAAAFVLSSIFTPRSIIVERISMLHSIESFAVRLKMLPLIFLHFPRKTSFKMFSLNRLTKKPINYIPLLYIAISIFYVSSGLFNTLYPASLYSIGLDKSVVLGIVTVGMLFQIITFHFVGHYLEDRDEKEVSFRALLLRGSGYIGMGISLITPLIAEATGLILYPLSAGVAYSSFYAASNTLIFKIVGGRRQGTTLGVYSTLVGIALFAGSLVSGFLSKVIGFTGTFITAGIMLYVSAWVFKYLEEG
ncbi:MFS transporter [Metallosphaera tengchongensis]|uniref:MFS transporter n=2 Tax=Metallosphaera tengchongensis TaxID=1532350 RepID=A0A6N0NXY2_9CREN|nr:MFS transporter [Metallosphaera tengchongensis]QKR00238.1 MFS transporter [Metallosphaera tengchongensis]